ncbi:MAG: hypothetical protein AAF416_13215 [Pseudomonadota bacterium]
MTVVIATPTMGSAQPRFCVSLATAIAEIVGSGRGFRYATVDNCYLSLARNYLMNLFLQTEGASHLLFIDSDMGVPEGVVERLLEARLPLAGALYARRKLEKDLLRRAIAAGATADEALAAASNFVGEIAAPGSAGGEVRVVKGFVPVRYLGFGCVLIDRRVPEEMIRAGVVGPSDQSALGRMGLETPVYDFFTEIVREDGERLGEDYSFCHRYAQLPEARMAALVDVAVGHVGSFSYGGRYLDHIAARRAIRDRGKSQ